MIELMVHTGVLLPESFLKTEFFFVLSTIVALNTTIYAALSIAKVLPKWFNPQWIRRGRARAETRSIYPDGPK